MFLTTALVTFPPPKASNATLKPCFSESSCNYFYQPGLDVAITYLAPYFLSNSAYSSFLTIFNN